MFKLNLAILFTLVTLTISIPYKDQIALVNSLEVGRNQDPNVWECFGCDYANKPIKTQIIQEPVKDVKAILSVYEEYSVLAFRYTATVKNVFQDILWAFQVQDQHAPSGCKVQKEYENMWNSIRSYTLNELRESEHTRHLIITGISLGGALANLAYVDIAHSDIFDQVQITTFGAPRVGNKKWAEWFNSQTTSSRYYIAGDPIAALPKCLTIACTYRQTGTPIACNKNNEICVSSAAGSDEPKLGYSEFKDLMIEIEQEYYEHFVGEDKDQEVGGIIDHIFGYKKIKDYDFSQ